MNKLTNENISSNKNVNQMKETEKIQNIDLFKEIENVINHQINFVQNSFSHDMEIGK